MVRDLRRKPETQTAINNKFNTMNKAPQNPRPNEQCVAQMGERVIWDHEAASSILATLTNK